MDKKKYFKSGNTLSAIATVINRLRSAKEWYEQSKSFNSDMPRYTGALVTWGQTQTININSRLAKIMPKHHFQGKGTTVNHYN